MVTSGGQVALPTACSSARRNKIADIPPAIQIKVCLYCIDLLFASASAFIRTGEDFTEAFFSKGDPPGASVGTFSF